MSMVGGDYVVANTDRGKGTVISLGLDKSFNPMSVGRFDLSAGYTHQDVDELRSYNRFVGFETYAFDAQTDMNNGQVAPSRYEVEDRFTAFASWMRRSSSSARTDSRSCGSATSASWNSSRRPVCSAATTRRAFPLR